MPHYKVRMSAAFGVGLHTGRTISVDETLHRELEEILGCTVIRSQRIDSGSINQAYRLDPKSGDTVMLRIAPSREQTSHLPSWLTHQGLRREQSAIARLTAITELLPITIAFRQSTSDDWGDLVIQSVVPGMPASQVFPIMTTGQRLAYHRQLGDLTRKIHQVDAEWFGPLSHGAKYPTWTDLVLADCQGFLEDASRWNLPREPFDALIELVTESRLALGTVDGVLIHSDLVPDHVFVERRPGGWEISGLIDLEFARFADPVSEGLIFEMLQRSDPDSVAFKDGYDRNLEVSELRIDVARRLQSAWIATDRARLSESP